MEDLAQLISTYRYLVLFLSVFAAQVALVFPVVPLLVSAGALAGEGLLALPIAVLVAVAALVPADLVWYELGRRRGGRILGYVCRIALEPDVCIRRTERVFARWGARSLVFAKFLPGLTTVALPLSGVLRMRRRRFMVYDGAGALLWATAYTLLGYGLSAQVAGVTNWRDRIDDVIVVTMAALAGYLFYRYGRRQWLLRQLRIRRVPVEVLQRRLEAGETVFVLDLRHPVDFQADPHTIPGALYIPAEEVVRRHREIPRDRDVVLYCTCPDEATSAREALRLQTRGVKRVRPLAGGFPEWRARGLPVEFRGPDLPPEELVLNAG
jgi:membrane protein DedA with SNARE-associated domain/rhodanese-related sulfurtransferase